MPDQEPEERKATPSADGRTDSLAQRLRGLYGEGVDPQISLGEEHEGESSPSAEILRRLGGRGSPFARYVVKDEIARGGQGSILRVWDEDLRRSLAMKLILGKEDKQGTAHGLDTRSLGRFLEEAQVTGQLDHPGIVPVHELGVDAEGRVYFTMKLVRGRDLKSIFRLVHEGKEDWTETRALGVVLKVCEAMSYAHSKGVIHRDLKPGNVMVGRFGEVHVMDWGLARVQGRADRKNIRIQPDEMLTLPVDVRRHEKGSHATDAPLVTMDGDVVGTPAYMSPEQAAGDLDAMGPHSDVYSAGAMLYHLLARQLPYVPPGIRLSNYAIWYRVQEGPPTPLEKLAREAPAELIAIVERAMARDPKQRYRDMSELADDLRAYLENRVVHAYETGAVAELKKWVKRNRPLAGAIAAGIVIALGGLTAVGWVQARGRAAANEQREIAEANAIDATQKGALALANAKEARRQAEIADTERANVLRLSALADLEDLEREAAQLWPPFPALVQPYTAWLERARALVAKLEPDAATGFPGYRAQLADLRARALPETETDRELVRRLHPRFPELVALEKKIDALRRAQDVRTGSAKPAAFQGDLGPLPETAIPLNDLVWPLIQPRRTIFGQEAKGLALARLAFERSRSDEERAIIGDTLAWALFANGLDDEALDASAAALDSVPAERRTEFENYYKDLDESVQAAPEAVDRELERLSAERDALVAEMGTARTWKFADEEVAWWHAQLAKLVLGLETLADERAGSMGSGSSPSFGWGIERRLAFARTIESRTLSGPEASARWAQAIASIEDPALSPAYGGLEIRGQIGLLPIGRDPDTGLWEFADLVTGDAPKRDEHGRLELVAGSGLVFVLLPGGFFHMGGQVDSPELPNYDPATLKGEKVEHPTVLSPFFLSKYEMTQEQWERLRGANPSFYRFPGEMHPVESVLWDDGVETLRWAGLLLPTEAQWEYAARAGTSTPWWTGMDVSSLTGAGNFAGSADGFGEHSPVGRFRANAFGLHDVHGNMWEWCRDAYAVDFYARADPHDPLNDPTRAEHLVARGGSFYDRPQDSRSAFRLAIRRNYLHQGVGVRPARALDR